MPSAALPTTEYCLVAPCASDALDGESTTWVRTGVVGVTVTVEVSANPEAESTAMILYVPDVPGAV